MADQPKVIGAFEVAISRQVVKISDAAQNEVVIRINYNSDDERLVRVTVSASCGRQAVALLESKNENVEVTSDHPNSANLVKLDDKDVNKASWQTRSTGIRLNKDRKQINVKVARFRCRTPPGDAKIEVAIDTKAPSDATWTKSGSCGFDVGRQFRKTRHYSISPSLPISCCRRA